MIICTSYHATQIAGKSSLNLNSIAEMVKKETILCHKKPVAVQNQNHHVAKDELQENASMHFFTFSSLHVWLHHFGKFQDTSLF